MPQINIPGHGPVDFPDNMSDDDISKAIQRNYPELHGAPKTNYSALSDSAAENILAGVGKTYVGAINSVKQMYQGVRSQRVADKLRMDPNNPDLLKEQAAIQADQASTQSEVDNLKGTDTELSKSKAGMAGELLGTASIAAAVPGVGTGLSGMLATGALQGAATGALTPTSGDESRLQNTAVSGALGVAGSALGAGVTKLGSKILNPFGTELTERAAADIKTLRDQGVPLDLAQSLGTQSKLMNNVKALVGETQSFSETQQTAYNKALLGQLGNTNATKATQGTMLGIKTRIGGVIQDIADRTPVNMDSTFTSHLLNIQSGAARELQPQQMHVIQSQIDNMMQKAADGGGAIDGGAFDNLSKSLNRLSQNRADPVTAHWAEQLHDVAHDALTRSAAPGDVPALNTARTQWRMMRQVEKAIDSQDNISPRGLYQAVDSMKNSAQVVYGQGDQSLVSLAQAGKNLLADSPHMKNMLGMHTVGLGLAAATELATGDPRKAVEAGLLGVGAKQLAKMAMENPVIAKNLAQWATSKVLRNYTNKLQQAGTLLGGKVGASALPVEQDQEDAGNSLMTAPVDKGAQQ